MDWHLDLGTVTFQYGICSRVDPEWHLGTEDQEWLSNNSILCWTHFPEVHGSFLASVETNIDLTLPVSLTSSESLTLPLKPNLTSSGANKTAPLHS
jgi:hypothetical protein